MTISNTLAKAGPFAGNGITVAFPFTFKVFVKGDVKVVKTSTAGVESILVLDTDYSVVLNADQNASPGGTVTHPLIGSPLALNEKLTLVSNVPDLQNTDLTNAGGFFPGNITDMVDTRTIVSHQNAERLSRSIAIPVSESGTGVELPSVAARANKFFGWDALGNPFPSTAVTGVVASAYGSTLVQAANAPAARGILSFSSLGETLSQLANAGAGRTALGLTTTANQLFTATGTGAIARAVDDVLRDSLYINVKNFGALGDSVTDDSAAVQAAINRAVAVGGTVYFPRGGYLCNTPLTLNGTSVRVLADCLGSVSVFSTTTTGIILQVTGSRNSIENMLIYRNTFSTSTGSVVVDLRDAVQCKIDNCWLQGGYYCLSITGAACADNIITRSIFTFATGVAMVWLARASAGLNGGHHFYRCLFNQGYAQGTPVAANYKARANTTAYALGDVISSAGYYFGCTVAGTTAGSVPVGLSAPSNFYGVNIVDGTAQWALQGSTSYRGIQIDTGLTYVRLRECDLTGPFLNAIDITNTLAGTIPNTIAIETCTAHGPIINGLSISAGREVSIKGLNTFNPTGPGTTTGMSLSGSQSAWVSDSQCYGFTSGIYVGGMSNVNIINNECVGNGTGIRVSPNTGWFNIIGNQCGSSGSRGANTNSIWVEAGTSDRYNIVNNIVNGAAAVADGGSGVNKTVASNW